MIALNIRLYTVGSLAWGRSCGRLYAVAIYGRLARYLVRFLLANVNSRSRSLYAVARPSVGLSVVCLSVTFVRPTQAVQIFGNISMALRTLAIH